MNYIAQSDPSTRLGVTAPPPAPNSGLASAPAGPAIEHRLSRALVDQPEVSFGSLAHLPSNLPAVQAAERFAAGLSGFVAIIGPSGWGKSHLLASVANRVAQRGNSAPQVLTATEWLLGITQAPTDAPLLLDNVQDLLTKPRLHHLLRTAIGQRVRTGESTMLSFTTSKAGRSLRVLLPSPRAWDWAAVHAPQPSERVLVLRHMAEAEHLSLSAPLVRLLASRLRGNGRTLLGALKRLKLYGADWQDAALTLRACGILDMFFRDNSDWDLCEAVSTACRQSPFGTDLAMYLMLREATLSEAHVAQFFRVSPCAAYQRSSALAAAMALSPELCEEASSASSRAVRSLFCD